MKQIVTGYIYLPMLSFLLSITHEVEINGFSFTPSEIEITVGDIVKWTNNHSFPHTATSTDFPQAWDDATIAANGGIFEVTLDAIGTFPYDCDFHSSMTGVITVTALGIENPTTLIETFQLHSNYPNPFNPSTSIEYSLQENAYVELIIYNIQGKQVQNLFNDYQTAGDYAINWDATLYKSGIYFAKMKAGEYVGIKKLMLIK